MPFTKAEGSSKHNQVRQAKPKCSQWDTLMLTLWMSRLFGAAPVCFQKNVPECPVKVSTAGKIYCKFLTTLLHACLIAGVIIDLYNGVHGVRVRGSWTRFAFIFELILIITTISVSAFGASERLEKTITYLKVIKEIKSNIGCPCGCRKSKINSIATTLYVISVIVLSAADFYTFYADSYYENKNYYIMYFYVSFYVELLVIVFLELQFMWMAMFVNSGLKSINNALKDLIYFIDVQRTTTSVTVDNILDLDTSYTVKSVNILVDTLTSNSEHSAYRPHHSSKYLPDKVRRLAVSYGTICDIIVGINESYGLLLLLILLKIVFNFIVTPFYFLNYWYSNRPRKVNLIVQIIFVIFHFSQMMLVVEPGYWTEILDEQTQTLTCRLMQRVSFKDDAVLAELDIFLKHITLNTVSYSPLKFCKLSRSLIPVILGGATTYLVIILQFSRLVEDDS